MSRITEWAAQQHADLTSIQDSLNAIATGVEALDKKIVDFNNSPGTLTPEDQAALDGIQEMSKRLVKKAQEVRVDAETEGPKLRENDGPPAVAGTPANPQPAATQPPGTQPPVTQPPGTQPPTPQPQLPGTEAEPVAAEEGEDASEMKSVFARSHSPAQPAHVTHSPAHAARSTHDTHTKGDSKSKR